MKIQPVGKRVLIKRVEKKEVSEGGILLPGNKSKEQMLGTIAAVSTSRTSSDFAVGDKVIFPDFTGVLVGKNYVIMEDKDIVATYTD